LEGDAKNFKSISVLVKITRNNGHYALLKYTSSLSF